MLIVNQSCLNQIEIVRIDIQVRSTYADDNVCEYINNDNCEFCPRCFMIFRFYGFNIDENLHVGIEYNQEIYDKNKNKIIVSPFSESLQFNYCPFCGRQISKNIKRFESQE